MSNVMTQFAERVAERNSGDDERMGFDWVTLVLTVVVPLIQNCLNNRNSLRGFVEGRRPALQVAALRTRCRQECRALPGVGVFQSVSMGNKLAADILAEADLVARDGVFGSGEGDSDVDVYQQAINEVNGVLV